MVLGTRNRSFPEGLLRSATEGSNPRGQMETHGGEGAAHSERRRGFSGAPGRGAGQGGPWAQGLWVGGVAPGFPPSPTDFACSQCLGVCLAFAILP